jgi:dolichol-phosphate mannosyltransferase
MKLSVVIPVYNEEDVLEISLPIIYANLEKTKKSELCDGFEIIIVNDGSTDKTLEKISQFQKLNQNSDSKILRVINMSGNQGHMKALEAGLLEFNGDCVITLDADLQDPPDAIIEMVRIFNETSIPCIQTVRSSRHADSIFKRNTASLYYRIVKILSGVEVIPNAADYRLLAKKEAKLIVNLQEDKKVLRLLVPYLKIQTHILEIERGPRAAGDSKYTLRKMIKLALDSFIGFSVKPLRIVLYMALINCLVFIGVAFAAIFVWLTGRTVAGWTSIALILLLGYTTSMVALAIIGEYIGRIYFHILGRPSIQYKEISIGSSENYS